MTVDSTSARLHQQHAKVPVLMYHSVASESSPDFREFVLDPNDFADHMAALSDAGYRPTTVSDYVSDANSHGDSKQIVLTFDDAFGDFYSTVLPVLQKYSFPATIYVPTDFVGQTSRWLNREGEGDRQVMPWSAIKDISDAGVEVGSHSCSHPQLDLLPPTRLRDEVVDSKRRIEDNLQRPIRSFAYPFGYYNAATKAAVATAGYESACAVRDLPSSRSDAYAISRWTIRHGMNAQQLVDVLNVDSGKRAELRSIARARASWILRRSGLKRRGNQPAGDPV